MKRFLFLLSIFSVSAWGHPPHLDLEMTSEEYRALLTTPSYTKMKHLRRDDPAITEAIRLGDRLSKWIKVVNDSRNPEEAIRLTSAATRRGIPIESPNTYSPSLIRQETRNILYALPLSMKRVILSEEHFPTSLGMDDETFILHARKIDKNYQSAVRYKAVDVYRSHYIEAASQDVRGYYYLTKNKIGIPELTDVQKIPKGQLPHIKDALIKICLNSNESFMSCDKKLQNALQSNTLVIIYKKYFARSQKNWESFFYIPSFAVRKDVKWNASVSTIPFNTPEHERFIPYLKNNIEDEFRFGNWSLKLIFGHFRDGPLLKFIPGEVPHVNALGGNEIVMDANQPIEEYESQWTIRHEFGHVLGLPDCYHEFYDTKIQAYVNYQLDITDLMCSRAGDMNERIYRELYRVYSR